MRGHLLYLVLNILEIFNDYKGVQINLLDQVNKES